MTDVGCRRLPDPLTLPAAPVVVALALASGPAPAVRAVTGAAALAAILGGQRLLRPGSLGAGDVKLALGVGAIGGACGGTGWLLTVLIPPLVTAVTGIVLGVARRRLPRTLPHGPSLCLGALGACAVALAGAS